MLAEVEQAEGDGEKARMCLAKAVDAPPDAAWLCQSTGEVRARWSAFGPDGRFDSLQLGQAAQDRADAWRRARPGDPAAAGGEGRAALGAQAACRGQAGDRDAAPPAAGREAGEDRWSGSIPRAPREAEAARAEPPERAKAQAGKVDAA